MNNTKMIQERFTPILMRQQFNELLLQIQNQGINEKSLRTNLSEFRAFLKKSTMTLSITPEQQAQLVSLFDSGDAKTRKNTALLLGELGATDCVDAIITAYKQEEQRFVKSAYLTALSSMNYRTYMPFLKEEIESLQNQELTVENTKHIQEQLRELSSLVLAVEGIKQHKFIGYKEKSSMMLLANRNHVDTLAKQLEPFNPIEFRSGVRLITDQLEDILPIRTYHEILFLVTGLNILPTDVTMAARKIVDSSLLSFLQKRHSGKPPFYFRIELKSSLALDKKSEFLKKLAATIESLSNRTFINSTSNYEFELRMVENSDGTYYTFVKLHTLKDTRFSYRSEVIGPSIKPVDAALLVELAKPYMIEDARVLDPFCGVGTMLIERQKEVKANTSYGIDFLEDAILKARKNTLAADQIIHYINRDFFEFEHEYLFDEIFTNMPFAMGHVLQSQIEDTYDQFFDCAKKHLDQAGRIIMYTHDREYVKSIVRKKGFEIKQYIPFFTKKETDLLIIERRS